MRSSVGALIVVVEFVFAHSAWLAQDVPVTSAADGSAIWGSPARAKTGRSRSSISTRPARTCGGPCASFPSAASRVARSTCAASWRR